MKESLVNMMEDEDLHDSDYESEENEGLDMQSVLEAFFLESKKNRNVVDVMCELKRSFETHNRILNAMYELLSTHLAAPSPKAPESSA